MMKRRQRVGLPTRAIQRQHLQLYQALLERMRHHERLELPEELAVPAELNVKLDRLDRCREALFLEPRPLGIEQLVPAGSLQRRSSPDAERLLDRRPRVVEPTVGVCSARPAECRLPAIDVEGAGLQIQDVAPRAPDQPVSVLARLRQRLTQT